MRKRRTCRCLRSLYQEPRQLQIQSCIPKTDCLDHDDDGQGDDADADDHDVDAFDFNDVGDDNDVDDVACSCRG